MIANSLIVKTTNTTLVFSCSKDKLTFDNNCLNSSDYALQISLVHSVC